MTDNTISIRGLELRPNGKQAAIVTSVHNYEGYSLDLTSRILDKEQYEQVILDEPLCPYAILPKSKSFHNLIGRGNRKIRVVGFLGFRDKRCFWMVQCEKCEKYSIRESKVWIHKDKKNQDEFCYNCDSKKERNVSKMVNQFKEEPIKRFKGKPKRLKILGDISKIFTDAAEEKGFFNWKKK